ncbi:MAG: chorismate lyase [Gammaproteobacteria bacterium]|nr:chorismate lyase [Gammaproteobacteria bacterium]
MASSFAEPRWRSQRQWRRGSVPEALIHWLLDTSSLTLRLRQACAGCFRVSVVSQSWQRPALSERRALGMGDAEFALVRQVRLLCDEQPWVFARTVIPVSTLGGARRRLICLGSKPLGAALFADRSMRRGEVEIAAFEHGQPTFERAVETLDQRPVTVWGRRSVFCLNTKPLMVSELFLPGIERCGLAL